MEMQIRHSSAVLLLILFIGAGCGNQDPVISTPSSASEATKSDAANGQPRTNEFPDSSRVEPATSAPPARPEEEPKQIQSEIHRDTFADAGGSVHWNRDGAKSAEGPPANRTIYFFNGTPEGGSLVMRIVEDGATAGPDGEPGVLALSWQEIPAKLPYSGFAYRGGRVQSELLTLPLLKQAKSVDDLRQFRLKFRYKGMNEQREGPFQVMIGCRLEPLLADSYSKRLDLGTLDATGDWNSFDVSLGDGKNSEAFLRAISDENPPSFKIIWSQAGPLTAYRPGDTLLIDDVVITGGESGDP